MQVVMRNFMYAASGFGSAAREIAFAMEDLGADVKVDVMGPRDGNLAPDVLRRIKRLEDKPSHPDQVLVTLDWDYKPAIHGHYRKAISCVMFETTRAPQPYVEGCNQFDGLILPNEFNYQAFRDAGVRVPIYLARYGVNTHVFSQKGKRDRQKQSQRRFVFLSVFGWSDRKGPDILVRAFLEEFDASEPVTLLIKTFGRTIHEFPHEWYDDIVRQVQNPSRPRVKLIVDDRTPEDMAALYRGSNCFVLPTRGEGVGLPILESMACGVPVIATGWSGHLDFFDHRSGYLIPYKLEPAHPVWFTNLYQPNQMWANPEIGALRTLMRRVYLHQSEAKQKGQNGASLARKWTWSQTAQDFLAAVHEIAGR